MRITIFSFLLVGIIAHTSLAQEIQPSQFLSAPLAYNPAMTGLMAGDMRAAVNYEKRSTFQYYDIHNTHMSYDMPIMRNLLHKGNAIGVGMMYHSESQYSLPMWTSDNSTAGISFAYHMGLGKKNLHHLSFGAQTIFSNYSYSFKSSYDSTYENGDGYRTSYNWGITYSGILSAKTALYGGFARYSSSMPFANDRYTLFTGVTRNMGTRTMLYANAAYNFKSGNELQASAYARFLLNRRNDTSSKPDIAAYAGLVFLSREAAMPYVGFEAARTRIGFSIDPRPLTSKSYPSASFQISLTYTGRLGAKPSPNWHCPSMY